jgi:hypothetical protein
MTAAPPLVAPEPTLARPIRSVATSAAVRLRPAPPLEPPFDDEADRFGMPGGSVPEGQLALDWRSDAPGTDDGPGRRRSGRPPFAGPADPLGPDSGRTDGSALVAAPPEHRVATKRFLGVCLEVLNGYRPAGQLRPFCAPAAAGIVIERFAIRSAALARGGPATARRPLATQRADAAPRAAAVPRADAAIRPGKGPRPDATTRPGAGRCAAGPPARIRLRLLRICEPLAGIAEAAAVLETGDRCWALAFRLERHRGTWLCTAVTMP